MALYETVETVEKVRGVGKAGYAVVWLHGLGADANDFTALIPALNFPAQKTVRFVFPNAPVRPVTLNGGLACRAWFDIKSLEHWEQRDDAGIQSSVRSIHQIIKQIIQTGIPSERIVLAGFSQGGMIALQGGLQFSKPLAGILALSTCLPCYPHECVSLFANACQSAPVLQMHGTNDAVLPYALGKASAELLRPFARALSFKSYSMGHEVCPAQVRDIAHWLNQVLR